MTHNKANYGDEDTIAAFSTAPGNSALTLIRCAGKGSIELADSVFASGKKLLEAAGNTVIHGWIVNTDPKNETIEKVDEVLVSVFRAPKSYTGEDSLDICCHGGSVTGNTVLNVLKNAGFRSALPGEFTFRAFLNGKLDLTRCESVMELVSAKTEMSRRNAITRLSGSLEKEINEVKQMLVQVLAGAEIFLDYSEDEISVDEDEVKGKLPNKELAEAALLRLKHLSASWEAERIYQEGVTVVIAGRPNAGKSSIFNLFLKEERSIVTDTPGTTRDWIEAWVSIKGIPVRLIDTAGLRETEDSVEKIGVERSRHLLQEADIVLYLIDGKRGVTNEDITYAAANALSGYSAYHIFVWNKCDAAPLPQPFALNGVNRVCVSAKTGAGFPELYAAISSAFKTLAIFDAQDSLSNASLGTVRQKKLVDAACASLEDALAMTEENPLDLIAPLLREAVNSLGEITGKVFTADILEEMFSRFCVGK